MGSGQKVGFQNRPQGYKSPAQMEQERVAELAKLQDYNAQFKKMTKEDSRITRQSELLKKAREEDLKTGMEKGKEIFTPGVLGRINDQAGDMKTLFDQRRSNLQGFTTEEQQALRENNMRELQRDHASAARDLLRNQGRNKVFGATAVAQQTGLQSNLQNQLAEQERKLFLDNINQKRTALDSFEKSTTDKEKFNIDQTNKELQGALNTQLTYAGLGTAERASVMNQILGEKQLKASLAASGGGGGKGK